MGVLLAKGGLPMLPALARAVPHLSLLGHPVSLLLAAMGKALLLAAVKQWAVRGALVP